MGGSTRWAGWNGGTTLKKVVSDGEDESRLLNSVKRWFEASEQVAYYAEEVDSGLSPGEKALLEALSESSTVLDVGCGAGRASIPLALRGFQVTGVDVSDALLMEAKRAADRENTNIRFMQVEGLELPFGDASFDAVLALKVYCYIPMRNSRIRYLEEIARVLKPGGVLLLSQYIVPDAFFDEHMDENYHRFAGEYGDLEPGDTFSSDGAYVHWFTEGDLRDELEQAPLVLEANHSDGDFGGAEFLRLYILRKPHTAR